ncbi:MAG: TolC family protein [Bacteroidales bacterium]|nr:TolC family protein [Bacteroidales bacterium]
MKLNSQIILFTLIYFIIGSGNAQEIKVFSLEEATAFGLENNYEIINSEKDVEAAKARVLESTALGLPQLNASINYTDNLARPTFILPGEFTGNPGQDVEIQFGTKYDATLGAEASQLIFSGQYLVGLKAAKKFLEKTTVDFFKNKLAVRQKIAESYYNVLATGEALRIIDTTLAITKDLADETRQVYEVGFAEDIDVDQLDLLVADLEASQTFFQNQLVITHAFLKFYLGLTENDSLVLTDDIAMLIENRMKTDVLSKPFNYNQHVDYVSLNRQKELTGLQVDLEKSAYLPTLSAKINFQTQAQRETWDFFSSSGQWYNSSAFGVSMQIPILSSGERRAKVKQARIAFEQVEVLEKQLRTSLNLEYQTARNEYLNAHSIYLNKDKNRKVSEKIYLKTTEKFKEGMASSLDILNTQNQFLNSQRDYINAANALLKAGLDLEMILTRVNEN